MKKLINIILISLLLYSILGCQYEPYEPKCVKGEYEYGSLCTEEYNPVCSPDGTTYSNLCYAIKDGWEENCIIEDEC